MRRLLALLIVVSWSVPAYAQGKDVEAARQAYDQGAAAYDAHDYSVAAKQLARADELAPNDVVLELALKAVVKANEPLVAMDLIDRATARRAAPALKDEAQLKFGNRVGKVTVDCPEQCTATFDDAPMIAKTQWALVGEHRVVIDMKGKQAFKVRVDPGANISVSAKPLALAATPLTPPVDQPTKPAQKSESGVSPTWFWVGTGLTLVLGGVTIASALDTSSKHEEFRKQLNQDSSQVPQLSADGENAQLRTNIFLASTVGAALITGILGLAFVRW